MLRPFASLLFLLLATAGLSAAPVRIMSVGDSITEGGSSFTNYRWLLHRRLTQAGHSFEFVGSKSTPSPDGPLRHEGYGGKNVEFLVRTVPGHFRQTPADIVLLHACHNHSAEEKPVAGIVAAHEKLIAAFREVNPKVTILLARPIGSLKLPKYSYLRELDPEFDKLAARLGTPESRIIVVDQGAAFDPARDTVPDQVHPNEKGAAKMAEAWFSALSQVLPTPAGKR